MDRFGDQTLLQEDANPHAQDDTDRPDTMDHGQTESLENEVEPDLKRPLYTTRSGRTVRPRERLDL